jgi:hypothetical protein
MKLNKSDINQVWTQLILDQILNHVSDQVDNRVRIQVWIQVHNQVRYQVWDHVDNRV